MKSHKTPGMHFFIIRPINDSDKISIKDQKLCWSEIGIMLYFVKHSKPDIAYAIWELYKVIHGVNPATFLKIHSVVKYALDTRNLGLKIELNRNKKGPQNIIYFSDSSQGAWIYFEYPYIQNFPNYKMHQY